LADALKRTLGALSETMIAAVIREHDDGHRLEGLLKIIQASQTDAGVRMLDERLARHLAQLLDENLGATMAVARPPIQLVDASGKGDAGKFASARSNSRTRAK
jgi:hypothetical protein